MRRLREQARLSRRELAQRAGVEEATVWRLEMGQRQGRPVVIAKLARVLAELTGRGVGDVLAELMGMEGTEPLEVRVIPRYLSLPEAARYLGLSQAAVRQAVREGRLRPRSIPGPRGMLVFSLAELDRFAESYLEAVS